eukprot:GHVU01126446.1.p1 GENE.GHVU01126446.1~~GHVU01126446.1.p1  ORF type:complete len:116 (+),score=0.86 GHVU01126446.1:332-679(+)
MHVCRSLQITRLIACMPCMHARMGMLTKRQAGRSHSSAVSNPLNIFDFSERRKEAHTWATHTTAIDRRVKGPSLGAAHCLPQEGRGGGREADMPVVLGGPTWRILLVPTDCRRVE